MQVANRTLQIFVAQLCSWRQESLYPLPLYIFCLCRAWVFVNFYHAGIEHLLSGRKDTALQCGASGKGRRI
nr:MAG TPA: hypothetical protein [Caudoviricetes sp.]